MEQYINEILITPGDLRLVLLVQRHNLLGPVKLAHPRQVHEHHTRVQPGEAVVRVPTEPIVPPDVGDLVLGGHGGKLRGVELLEVGPDLLQRAHEEDVRVDVENGIHIEQKVLL